MVFNSLTFLVYFVVVLAVYYFAPISWRARKNFLMVASYLFYAAWNPPFVLTALAVDDRRLSARVTHGSH